MLAAPFLTLPSKRKLPQYYQRVTDPIDLCTLEQNIVTGFYRTVESFDRDMSRLFNNNVRFFGRTSELGIAATRLRKAYNLAKTDFLAQIEDILGESPPASFIPEHDPGLCSLFFVIETRWSSTSTCVIIVHYLHIVPEVSAFWRGLSMHLPVLSSELQNMIIPL
jgi:hypothetical protein